MDLPPLKSNIDTNNDALEHDSPFKYGNFEHVCYISGGVVIFVFQCFTSYTSCSGIPRIE